MQVVWRVGQTAAQVSFFAAGTPQIYNLVASRARFKYGRFTLPTQRREGEQRGRQRAGSHLEDEVHCDR